MIESFPPLYCSSPSLLRARGTCFETDFGRMSFDIIRYFVPDEIDRQLLDGRKLMEDFFPRLNTRTPFHFDRRADDVKNDFLLLSFPIQSES